MEGGGGKEEKKLKLSYEPMFRNIVDIMKNEDHHQQQQQQPKWRDNNTHSNLSMLTVRARLFTSCPDDDILSPNNSQMHYAIPMAQSLLATAAAAAPVPT